MNSNQVLIEFDFESK